MKLMRFSALMLALLCLLPACGKDETPEYEMPETHAAAINPDSVSAVHIIHYAADGTVDLDVNLEANTPFVPLLATVYDKAAVTTLTGERVKLFDLTMTTPDGDIALTLYSDMTMDQAGGATLTAQDMYDFLCSFLPIPSIEKTGIETVA